MTAGLLLAVVFTIAWIPLYILRTEDLWGAYSLYSRSERWSTIGSASVLGVHMTAACITISLSPEVSPAAVIGSLVLFGTGLAFWLWARVQIGPLRARRLPDQPPPRLRRDGAFGLARHPLYLGVLVAAAAPLLVAPRPWLFLTYGLCVGMLILRALQEERRYHAQLGPEYAAYCREVKRLVPFLW
jgi:protein-S-isoprenylcysteine O-methyltransferase Ste14